MTESYNGFGTTHLEAGPSARVDDFDHYDAVVAISAFWVPLWPLRAEHVRTGTLLPARLFTPYYEYLAFPLRLERKILLRAYVRRIAWLLLPVAGMALILAANHVVDPPLVSKSSHLVPIGLGLAALAAFLFWCVRRTYRRDARIRNVLGRHERGTSDPLDWGDEGPWTVKRLTLAESGAESLEAVVAARIVERDLAGAMFYARVLARTDDRRLGEELTDRILEAAEGQTVDGGRDPTAR